MCGIVGIIGQEHVCEDLLEGLSRLEYRGYDSAGIAVIDRGFVKKVRASGKLNNLRQALINSPIDGSLGIGHTRWATHGEPTERNAHPHASQKIAVVHNGIIENFQSLKEDLEGRGYIFRSQTDTEVVLYLLEEELTKGSSPLAAVQAIVPKMRGAFALALLFADFPDLLIGVRQGAPLALGYGEKAMFLGSDSLAFPSSAQRISYLEDGDIAVLTKDSVHIYTTQGALIERPSSSLEGNLFFAQKGNHRHFMHKEIFEQPEVLSHALSDWIELGTGQLSETHKAFFDFKNLNRLSMTGCGTAFYAGLVARYWFERYAHLPVDVEIASEFRYREAPLSPHDITLVISQSGETADTLAALRYCKSLGQKTAALVNVMQSTIARESACALRICAGPEIGVASTKAFLCQIGVLACLSLLAGQERGILSPFDIKKLSMELIEIPRLLRETLREEANIAEIAHALAHTKNILYIGRGTSFPIALEGALKLKELSYIHAEGHAAGELKHGVIALVDEAMPVVVLAPRDHWHEKTLSNMEEVMARGAQIILVSDAETLLRYEKRVKHAILLPTTGEIGSPFLYTLPMQLLAYHAAVHLGTDVDQPRNLAKSVTVE